MPVVLPAGVEAGDGVLGVVSGSPALVLPAPRGIVEYAYLEDYRVGGRSVWSMGLGGLWLAALRGSEGEPVEGVLELFYSPPDSRGALLVVADRVGPAWRPPAGGGVSAAAPGGGVLVVGHPAGLRLPPIGPRDHVVVAVYEGGVSEESLVAVFRVEGGWLREGASGLQPLPLSAGPRPALPLGVWDRVLVESAPWAGSSEALRGSLGPLLGRGGVTVSGWRPVRAVDRFLVPGGAAGYEVWAVVAARRASEFEARLLIDGRPAVSAPARLGPGERLILGVRVYAPEGGGLPQRLVEAGLELRPRGRVDLVYHVHATVESRVQPWDPFLRRVAVRLAGPAPLAGRQPGGPPCMYIPEGGSLTLYAPVPAPLLAGSGSLTVELRGSRGERPRFVEVYAGDRLVCSGLAAPAAPGGEPRFRCSVQGGVLDPVLRGSLRLGRALPVKIVLHGGPVEPYTWCVEEASVELTSRARLYVREWSRSWAPYAQSLPGSRMWSLSYPLSAQWLQAAYTLHMSSSVTLTAFAGFIAGDRPHVGSGEPATIHVYIPAGGNTWVPSYTAANRLSLVDGAVGSIEALVKVTYTGTGPGLGDLEVVEARLLGGGPRSQAAMRAMGLASWLAGAASMIVETVSSLASKMAGLASLLLGFPSSFYQGGSVDYSVAYTYRSVVIDGQVVNLVREARLRIVARPGWLQSGLGSAAGVSLVLGASPPPGRFWSSGDEWTVRVEGRVAMVNSDALDPSYWARVQLPFQGSARFPAWRGGGG
ncbi:MAG: hypothetical protein GXO15_05830 [Crenarchaeota archaeon]|nr:hypothetical protein [Thermoproteota archaeon]